MTKEKPQFSNPSINKEIEKVEKQFESFEKDIKDLQENRSAPKAEVEQQTKMSNREAQEANAIVLKPKRILNCKAKFNENFREQYNFKKEYVRFIAENRELIGSAIEMWTKPFAGVPYEFWEIPANKPVMGPRYLAEQIKNCSYRRLKMEESRTTGSDSAGTYYGTLVADTVHQRLDAIPVSDKKSIFMTASGF